VVAVLVDAVSDVGSIEHVELGKYPGDILLSRRVVAETRIGRAGYPGALNAEMVFWMNPMDTGISGNRNLDRGANLVNFPGIWTHTNVRLMLAAVASEFVLPR
jgi:hypothetical protein